MTGNLRSYALVALIVSIPFNGVRPLLNVGELSIDGFFYTSLIYMAVSSVFLLTKAEQSFSAAKVVVRTQAVYIVLIIASLILDFRIIATNFYGGRTGFDRFATSTLTYGYYLALTCALAAHAKAIGLPRFFTLLSAAFTFVGSSLVAVLAIEILSWFFDPVREMLTDFRSLYSIAPEPALYRLSGYSGEPSFNAFALQICIPWVAFSPYRRHGWYSRLLTVALVALCAASGARSAYVGLIFMAIAYLLCLGTFRAFLPRGLDGFVLVAASFVIGIVGAVFVAAQIDSDWAVSNITRSYLMMGGVEAGLSNLSGQGFGQATFHVVKNISAEVQYSWELLDFYRGTRFGDLPPLFSWYTRTFGEFGVLGYALLGLSFSLSAKQLFCHGHATKERIGKQMFVIAGLLLAQFLAVGYSIESLRIPQFWFAWLLLALVTSSARAPKRVSPALANGNMGHGSAIIH